MVRSMWVFEIVISPGKTDSRGVAILFNNNFEYEILHTTSDEKGNYLAIELTIEKHNILLINIYGPNRDDPEVFISNCNTCTTVKHEEKWKILLNLDDSFCWKAIYNALFKCTKDSKLGVNFEKYEL